MEVILFVSQLDVKQQSIEDNHVFRIEAISQKVEIIKEKYEILVLKGRD